MTPNDKNLVQKKSAEQPEAASETKPQNEKHPVLLYILILFVAALLLMGLSFLSSQHRNSQTLGEIQNSVSALQEMQSSQDQLLLMQQQLHDLEKQNESLSKERDFSAKQADALEALTALQLKWLQMDVDGCRSILQDMADRDLVSALPTDSEYGTTSPAQRYEELKFAILNTISTAQDESKKS